MTIKSFFSDDQLYHVEYVPQHQITKEVFQLVSLHTSPLG